MAALFAVTQASHGLGATTADTLFLLRFGVEFLPVMILSSGAAVMLATILHMAGIARFGAGKWLAPVLLALGAWVAIERVGVATDLPGIYPVIWIGAQVAILVSYTVIWNAAGEACTTRQAKRLYPIFASAGIAGAIIANGLAGLLASALGTENLLWIHAGLLAAASGVMSAFVRPLLRASSPGPGGSIFAELRSGLEQTRRTPVLRLLAWMAILISVLFFIVVFAFNGEVAGSFNTEADVAGFLGVFSAVATALTFAVSMFGASHLFTRFGVVATLMILPAVYAIGFGLWLVAFGLVTATVVRGAQWIAVNALGGTAWNSLFNVIPGRRRSQALAFNTAIPTQLGTMAAGALLMLGSFLPPSGPTVLGFVLATLAIVLGLRMRSAYADALVKAVHGGLVEVFSAPTEGIQKPILDGDAHRVLSNALTDPNPGTRAAAATLLGRLGPGEAASFMERAVVDESPRVRSAALRGLADRPESVQLARQLIADPSPEVRRRAVQTLERHGAGLDPASVALFDSDPVVRAAAAILCDANSGRRVIDKMLASSDPVVLVAALEAVARGPGVTDTDPTTFLSSPDRLVRAAAARGLVGRDDRIPALRELLDDPSVRVRAAAAETLAADPSTVGALVDVLAEGSVRACEAALQALSARGLGGERCSQWIAGEVARARYLRFHRTVLAGENSGETRSYLVRLLASREQRLERWALMALTIPATEAIIPVIKRGIWSPDPEMTAQALEALDSIEERSLVSELISLLEEESIPPTHDATASLVVLAKDKDEWIRALAVRCLVEARFLGPMDSATFLADDQSHLVPIVMARSGTKPDGSGAEEATVEKSGNLDTVDRVLALQRVSIFSDIDPEDLERIAEVAAERHYEPDEAIYRYGEEGEEILVIISGDVYIRRPNGDAIRTYGAGEPVGELAFLRRHRRAADVIAGGSGVHALALGAAVFEVILEERPAVARAMLATLAERLGTA
jgi:CRP-like cAMP-binding protein